MDKFRNPSFLFSVLTATFITIAGGTLWNKVQDVLSSKISSSDSPWLVIFLVFSMALLIIMMNRIVRLVEGLSAKNRLLVRYYSTNDLERVYDESQKIIEEAKEDGTAIILAVNSFTEMYEDSSQQKSVAEKARQSYFEAIEKKIGKVDYHRILQVNTEHIIEGELSHKIASSYETHFLNIVKKRDQGNSNKLIILDQVPAKYPTSFVIVSNKSNSSYLIWQINEHVVSKDSATDALKLKGVFLITDPDEQIIQHFKGWFSEISNSPRKKAVEKKDLVTQNSSISRFEQKKVIEEIVQTYYKKIDEEDFDTIICLFSDKIYYKRGSKIFNGRNELEQFYRNERLIQNGEHQIKITTSHPHVYVTGSFEGRLRDGKMVKVDFEDSFKFQGDKIIKRITSFHGDEI